MNEVRIKVILAVCFFCLQGIVAWPDVLGHFLADAYIGEQEERRYFMSISLLSFAGGICSLGMLLKSMRRPMTTAVYIVGVALSLELTGAIFVYLYSGQSHLPRWQSPFTYHPTLVGLPTPNFHKQSRATGVDIVHNSSGFRGEEFRSRDPNKIRILAIGGSTTYGVLVSTTDTWTVKLEEFLGDSFEVLNLGVPGHTSAEHIILTALRASDFDPDYIIYYMGWNDIRNSNLQNLKSDYSDFHFLNQYGNLHVEKGYTSKLATMFILKYALVKLGELDPPKQLLEDRRGRFSDAIDERLVHIYERNISLLTSLSRTLGAKPIFVPQVLNQHSLTSEESTFWAPNVPARGLITINRRFNESMRITCESTGGKFVMAPMVTEWEREDFLDHGHFSAKGNEKFARILYGELKMYVMTRKSASS